MLEVLEDAGAGHRGLVTVVPAAGGQTDAPRLSVPLLGEEWGTDF